MQLTPPCLTSARPSRPDSAPVAANPAFLRTILVASITSESSSMMMTFFGHGSLQSLDADYRAAA